MYLVHENNIYSLNTSKERLRDYRIHELSTIEESERLFLAETIVKEGSLPLFGNRDKVIFNSYEANNEDRDFYHVLYNFSNGRKESESIYRRYYNGEYINKPLIEIIDGEKSNYYILLNQFYSLLRRYPNGNSKQIMTPIMQVTKNLYLLELFLNKEYERLKDKDLSGFLDIFEFLKIDKVLISGYSTENDEVISLLKKNKQEWF